MTRFTYIPEYEDFFISLKLSLSNYAVEFGVTAYQYFAEKLHIKGVNNSTSLSNLINPNTGKDLKTRELILLMDNLQEHSKPILDYLCNRYGFVCSASAKSANTSIDNLKDILLDISSSDGLLVSEFLECIKDDELVDYEKKQLIKSSYKTRSKLIKFENLLGSQIIEDELDRLYGESK